MPLFNERTLNALQHGGPQQTGAYTLLFVFYFAMYLVGIFFNSALIACALDHMNGGRPTIGYGLKAAWERFPLIFVRAVEQRVGIVGRIVVGARNRLAHASKPAIERHFPAAPVRIRFSASANPNIAAAGCDDTSTATAHTAL